MSRRRDEQGTVAIMVAFLSLLLMSLTAMAVDLGMARSERRDVQTVTDSAALAGAAGNNLPGSTPGSCPYGLRASGSDQAVKDVAAHLASEGWPQPPSASDLVDCRTDNGEVLYGSVSWTNGTAVLAPNPAQLTVISPGRAVNFGFAKVMGFDRVTVDATATAEIKSPALKSLPLYAFTGCDYGRQTISQPSNGHTSGGVTLSHGSESNAATISSIATQPASTPPTIPLPAPDPAPLTITGQRLGTVTKVGFFEPGSAPDPPEPVQVGAAGFTIVSGTSIQVPQVPAAVLAVPGLWYVRVLIDGQWSQVPSTIDVLALTIGTPTLTCGQGSSEGNFGTLLLANSGANGQSDQIALNIADRLEHSLSVYPTPAADWTCTAQQPGARLWPNEATNCVDTKPGMVANAARAGLIDGIGARPGLLTHREAGSGCAPSGIPATTTVTGGIVINNDTLSCFLTDDTSNIGMISSSAYAGNPVLSPVIFNSPRFVMVPLLGRQPTSGGSVKYQIVGFRPAFITNQLNSATRSSPSLTGNGLTLDTRGDLASMQVVFINAAALPPMRSAVTTPYAGSGPRVLRLVD